MSIKTSMSMSGFIASTPRLTRSDDGEARAYIRVGQEHWVRNEDATFTQQEPTFHDLVLFGRTAERAAAVFAKGDKFIAEGYLHSYQSPNADGVVESREEFAARKIGHDAARTLYQVDRTPRVQQGPTNTCQVPPAEQTTPATVLGI
ncbi:MAG: single-stranded DNA-binding protein [Propionibacteriaceae bacterium]|jgi:single-stranded DNA-binding protein|nr:single-stranded DNA-binding protein [Propionibacteriaceae bacterium]